MPLNLALEPLFGWFSGSEDGVRLEKSSIRREAKVRGMGEFRPKRLSGTYPMSKTPQS